MKGIPRPDEINQSKLILSLNRALLGEIRPNMRRVSIEYKKDKKKVTVYFFYDTKATQDDMGYDVEGTITAEMSADFPSEIIWEEQAILVPYPNRLPENVITVFRR